MKWTLLAASLLAIFTLTSCAGAEPAPTPTVTVTLTVTATPEPVPTVTVTAVPRVTAPAPDDNSALDLTTDAGLCAADAELTNLELNDALAPLLGIPANRDSRTAAQDAQIREHKNAAFARACPARVG